MRAITLSVMPSVLTQPLLDGEVAVANADMTVRAGESIDKNSRDMLQPSCPFQAGEMAVATFLKAREQGLPLVALPVYTSGRRFLQAGFAIGRDAGLRDLGDLRGKTVALPQYWMSSSVWQRQILQQVYGVQPAEIHWITTQPERMDQLGVPAGVEMQRDTSGRSPRDLLEQGAVDAALTPGGGKEMVTADSPGRAIPVFPDLHAAEREYFQRTGIFPIMHATVVREDLLAEEPAIYQGLWEAYEQAKARAKSREVVQDALAPSAGQTTRALQELLGDDPWPYGIQANRRPLEALVQAAYDQGMVDRLFSVDELFPARLLDAAR